MGSAKSTADDEYEKQIAMIRNARKEQVNEPTVKMNRPKHEPKGPYGLAGSWLDRLTVSFNNLSKDNELREVNSTELIADMMHLYELRDPVNGPEFLYGVIQDGLKQHIIVKLENGMLTKAHN